MVANCMHAYKSCMNFYFMLRNINLAKVQIFKFTFTEEMETRPYKVCSSDSNC